MVECPNCKRKVEGGNLWNGNFGCVHCVSQCGSCGVLKKEEDLHPAGKYASICVPCFEKNKGDNI